ncbi:MAG: hypothetical protein GW949_01195 [Spirochaetales bacterium]|nr:hypothetical protein [Spirochaetales bacterium]
MSDDFLEGDEDVGGGDSGASEGGKKRVGFMPAIVIQILKWAAIVLGMIIFVVTIVVITLNILGTGTSNANRTDVTEDYRENLPVYEFFDMEEFRGVTADEVRNTYVVNIQLGYDAGDSVTVNEIIGRRVQLTDQILLWFSSQNAAYLLNANNREEIRSRVRALVNQIMTRDIKEVRFTNFQILNF